MNIALLLEMAAEAAPDRVGLVCEGKRWTYGDLLDAARGAFQLIQESEVEYAALLDDNCEAATIAMFGAALAGVPYCPLDSRVRDQELTALLDRIAPALVIGDEERATRIAGGRGHTIYSREEFSLKAQETVPAADAREYDPGEGIAVQLFTNGTAAAPKAAILRHSKLLDYIQDTVEFGSAGEGDSALLVVPPFNSAGISAMLSSIYSLRRIVMLPKFSPDAWLHLVQAQQITDSIMESTTLARIINAMEQGVARDVSSLRAIDYGGGTMPAEVIRKALERFPGADFTNAYCLTGTSSAIALLGPEDHRMAVASGDPRVVARLGSLGKPITTVEIEIRGEDGKPVPPGEAGEIYVRGEQVSGEYMEKSNPDAEGWFSTRDAGYMDEDGYLFLATAAKT